MDREGQRVQALQQRGCGSVQKFVPNAVDSARKRRRGRLPARGRE